MGETDKQLKVSRTSLNRYSRREFLERLIEAGILKKGTIQRAEKRGENLHENRGESL